MRFHHMCIITADLQKAIHLWRDVLGFRLQTEVDLPVPGDNPASPMNFANSTLMDDSYGVKGARSKLAWLTSREGAAIELQEPQYPPLESTPRENLRYRHAGIKELGLLVDDIEAMFKKVRDAGYKTTTDYIWSAGAFGRSFIFYDDDGSMIQLWGNAAPEPKPASTSAH